MVLQHIVWPECNRPEVRELYYHATRLLHMTEDGTLMVPAGECVRFDTYFNAFSGAQWSKYTTVTTCTCRIRLSGKGEVRLVREDGVVVGCESYDGVSEIVFPVDRPEAYFYYIEIGAQEETGLYEGAFETREAAKKVALALVTCTFNRQAAVSDNVNRLVNKNVATVGDTPVLEKIFVIDNASNLAASDFAKERVILVPNRNTGGAGGFTRGIEEAMSFPEITHILLMDDDVIVEFEAMVRTKSVLSFLKEEYADCFIGGAMFRTDVPYVMHAAGEGYDGRGRVVNPYKSTDLRELAAVKAVSEPLTVEQPYAGWWYCCVPRCHVEKKGYPMPYFLHVDDIEYSLRSGRAPLYFNGIAVWHEEFDGKRSSMMEYYDVRNRLITNCLYKEKGRLWDAVYIVCERFYSTVFRYRYEDFMIAVKGVEDFLKGPEWLVELDSERHNGELRGMGYRLDTLTEAELCMLTDETGEQKSTLYTLCRYALPAKGSTAIRIGVKVGAYAGKKRVLLVEEKSEKGFWVEKSLKMTIKCLANLIKAIGKVLISYGKVKKEWGIKKDWVMKKR